MSVLTKKSLRGVSMAKNSGMPAGMGALKGLAIALLVVGVTFVLFFILMGFLQKTACEQGTTSSNGSITAYWSGSQCQVSSSNTTVVVLDSVTAATTFKNLGTTVIGIIGFVVIVAIFVIVMKMVRGLNA